MAKMFLIFFAGLRSSFETQVGQLNDPDTWKSLDFPPLDGVFGVASNVQKPAQPHSPLLPKQPRHRSSSTHGIRSGGGGRPQTDRSFEGPWTHQPVHIQEAPRLAATRTRRAKANDSRRFDSGHEKLGSVSGVVPLRRRSYRDLDQSGSGSDGTGGEMGREEKGAPKVCLAFLSCCGRIDLLEKTMAAAVRHMEEDEPPGLAYEIAWVDNGSGENLTSRVMSNFEIEYALPAGENMGLVRTKILKGRCNVARE